MKKIFIVFLAALLLLGLCSLAAADDLSFTILEDGTAELSSYTSDAEAITVPDQLGGVAVTRIGDSCFLNCSAAQSIKIPATVTAIGQSAFSGCESLTAITLPAKLQSIGDYAFYDCSALTAIVIPETVTEIGAEAFSASGLTEVVLPAGTAVIGERAFAECPALEKATVKSKLTESGSGVFTGCPALTAVVFGEGAEAVPASMFEECAALTDVTLPKSLLSIEAGAFNDCDGLAAITIPANVTTIGTEAFAYSDALASVALPANLETIGENAFYECTALAEITIPDKTVTIADGAFNGCSSLQKVIVPDSVAEIGESAFSYVSDNAWLVVGRDSYAASWCTENEIRLRYRDGSPRLSYFGDTGSMYGLIQAADNALQLGENPTEIYQELLAEAKEYDYSPWLEYQLENMAAYGSAAYEKTAAMNEDNSRTVYNSYTSTYGNDKGLETYGNYDVDEYSDAFKAMIADKNAQYCFEPIIWTEAECSYTQFTPSRSRAGYICVIVKKGAESGPGKAWAPGDDADVDNLIGDVVPELMRYIDNTSPQDLPVLTGNPNLASVFLVFDVRYTFYATYGSEPDLIKGYHTTAKVTAVNATNRQTIAELSATNELGDTIYWWNDDNTATAYLPSLTENEETFSNYFAAPVLSTIQLQNALVHAERVVTTDNAETVVNALLLKQTVGNADVWQNAIWTAGAHDVTFDEETGASVTFALRGFNPQVESLGAFADATDSSEWLLSALTHSAEYNLNAALVLESGRITDESLAEMKTAVAETAAAAKEAYTGEEMSAALLYWLLPSPVEGGFTAASQLMDLPYSFSHACALTWVENSDAVADDTDRAIVIASMNSIALDFSGGPNAVTYSGNGADPAFVSETADALFQELAFRSSSNRPDLNELSDTIRLRWAEKALSFHGSSKTKFSFTVNPDELTQSSTPLEYRNYLNAFPFGSAYSSLYDSCSSLPDEAAIPFPDTGLMTEKRKGTTVNVVIPSTADATYVQMRSESTGEVLAAAFIHPGKKVSMKVPSGQYTLLYCSGPYWYGTELLFGDNGTYKKSDTLEIKDARYTHTLTLETSRGGGIGVYGASASDFQ